MECSFRLARVDAGTHRVSFRTGWYDPTRTLVVDPIIEFSTYFGGTDLDSLAGLVSDGRGGVFLVGTTRSTDLPTVNALDLPPGAGDDAFVAWFQAGARGVELRYCAYLGGAGKDEGRGVALDREGRIHVTGTTESANFPIQGVQAARTRRGLADAFCLALDPDRPGREALLYSTYLGGEGLEEAGGIAADPNGAFVVAVGSTASRDDPATPLTDEGFPMRGGAHQRLHAGGERDAFLVVLIPARGELAYSTYLGGAGDDRGTSVALGAGFQAYVAGSTIPAADPAARPLFPVLPLGAPSVAGGGSPPRGGREAFLACFDLSRAEQGPLVFSAPFGGSSDDESGQVAVSERTGEIFVVGDTQSDDFPSVQAPLELVRGGLRDAFLVGFQRAGPNLFLSCLLGGAGDDFGRALAVDSRDRLYVAGDTASANFPLLAPVRMRSGDTDAFVAVLGLDPAGRSLRFSSALGGSAGERAFGVAPLRDEMRARGGAGEDDQLWIAGQTSSTEGFPLVAPLQAGLRTGAATQDLFLAAIRTGGRGRLALSPRTLHFGTVRLGRGKTREVKLRNTGDGVLSIALSNPTAPFRLRQPGSANPLPADQRSFLLDPGQERRVQIQFAPALRGTFRTELIVGSGIGRRADTRVRLLGMGR